jgi:hypothetical protein
MYGIPSDLNLLEIINDRVDSIGIQEFQIIITFDHGVAFTIESEIKLTKNEEMIAEWEQNKGWSSIAFQTCIGKIANGL